MRRWRAVMAAVLCISLTACAGSKPNGDGSPPQDTLDATGGPAPMGWSSWSFLRKHPTAVAVEAQARALKSNGLAALGYRYVNLDDFWMACDSHGPAVDSYGGTCTGWTTARPPRSGASTAGPTWPHGSVRWCAGSRSAVRGAGTTKTRSRWGTGPTTG